MAKTKNLGFGSNVLELSRFNDEFEAAQQAAKDEYEAKRKANEQKRREQKRVFDAEEEKFRLARQAILEPLVYTFLRKLGLKIAGELGDVLGDPARLEMLDGAGGYEVLFTKDKEVLEALCLFIDERADISEEIVSFISECYEEKS